MPAAWAALACALLCFSSTAEGLRKGRHLQVGSPTPEDSVLVSRLTLHSLCGLGPTVWPSKTCLHQS